MRSRRQNIRSRIFRNCLLVATVAALVCMAIFSVFAYREFTRENHRNLHAGARYLAQAVETGGMDYLSRLEPEPGSRITWIGPTGEVLYDTEVSPASMDNHRNREEIQEALSQGYGESTRYSDTLGKRTCNFATRISDGSVVRFSAQETTGLALVRLALPPALGALALAALLAMLSASLTSRKIVEPINRIDLQNPAAAPAYEELEPLVQRIGAQNRQLQEQMEGLTREHEKQDKFRRDFTANVSHELKTPLTSISGFAEIIRDGLVRPEDIPRFAGNIYKEAQRLITLVGDIIKISQMDDKQVPIQRELLDLRQLCSDVMDHLSAAADQNGVHCYLEGDASVPLVLGARQIADEMLYNLCDNAIKYNVPGGTVRVRVTSRGDAVAVSVSDTGIGIPKEHQGRVFERFYRVDKNRSKAIGGTGLGLSIVKHGALYHGATLDLASTPGVGTTITVIFPLTPPPSF